MLAPAAAATVLIVEDDRQLRDLYKDALAGSRYRVSAVADGLSALSAIDRDAPDVVILDLGLPRVSGWDVYRDLRSRAATRTLPIIIATGNDLRDIEPRDIAAVLQKPIDLAELVAAVERALSGD